MRRFSRLRRVLRRVFGGSPEPSPEPPYVGGAPVADWREREKPLPPGWQFEALYHRGRGMTPNPDPTDDEIAGADAIIVSYTDALGKDYRTIHRANTRKKVGRIIDTVTIPDSPR